jgi:hypothetical protein
MTLLRLVCAEALDHLPAHDPAAQRSRRDLLRVHWAMGTRSIVARGWQALVPTLRSRAPLKILELGAGDGTLLLGVARALLPSWPQVHLTLLDRQTLVSAATQAGFAALGWRTTVEVTDALDGAARRSSLAPKARRPAWDLITTSLFLHHFEGPALDALLAGVAASGQRFFACAPHRGWLAGAGSRLVGALGANAVTRHDAVLSVAAGFRGTELTQRWPAWHGAWQCREYGAGLFSHGFSAQRSECV